VAVFAGAAIAGAGATRACGAAFGALSGRLRGSGTLLAASALVATATSAEAAIKVRTRERSVTVASTP
jgi:hypothetical protein